MSKSNYHFERTLRIATYLILYIVVKCLFIIYQLTSITSNAEIISADFINQHIVGISPYFDIIDIIVLPLLIITSIITGFCRDIYSWRSIFMSVSVISLMLISFHFNSMVVSFLIIPLSLTIFSITLSSAIKLQTTKRSAINMVYLFYGVFVFLFPQLWQIFYSKRFLTVESLESFSSVFYYGAYTLLAIFIATYIYGIAKSGNIKKIKNNMVRFLIATLRFPLKSIQFNKITVLIILFSFIQLSRFIRVNIAQELVNPFDVSLGLLLLLEFITISIFCVIGAYCIKTRNSILVKIINACFMIFIICLLLSLKYIYTSSEISKILFYAISATSSGILAFCSAHYIASNFLFRNKYIGFQIGVLLVVIMVSWRIAFFVADFIANILHIGL
ncbi:hypothetical protein OAO18_03710 [Francisellaceae bacterium]|nr:hypothetical protein [Francisellaceae bacterium]